MSRAGSISSESLARFSRLNEPRTGANLIHVITGRYYRRDMQLYVEGWAPEYGSPYEADDDLAAPDKVDEGVEVAGRWQPIPGTDDGVDGVAFVDGVRRIDARLMLETAEGPVPGICGSFGVGAVLWDRAASRSEVSDARVDRVAVFGHGAAAPVPSAQPTLRYRSISVPEQDAGSLIKRFHGEMRKAEGELSERLARDGTFVVADGPLNDLSATDKVGYIKTHRAPYLSPSTAPVIGRLRPGERTPLFLIAAGTPYARYSWYQRLASLEHGHSWTGVVRVEVSSHLPLPRASAVADRTAAVLPLVASLPHIDPRAPQNLVPIGALERELRRRMGDAGYVYRELRSAVAAEGAVTGAAVAAEAAS